MDNNNPPTGNTKRTFTGKDKDGSSSFASIAVGGNAACRPTPSPGVSDHDQGLTAKKKRKPSRPTKDSDLPVRPLTAYNLFFRDERVKWLKEMEDDRKVSGALHDEQSHSVFQQMGKAIGSRWKSLDPKDKEKYKKIAQDDSERYREEMEEYKDKLVRESAIGAARFRSELAAAKQAQHEGKSSSRQAKSSSSPPATATTGLLQRSAPAESRIEGGNSSNVLNQLDIAMLSANTNGITFFDSSRDPRANFFGPPTSQLNGQQEILDQAIAPLLLELSNQQSRTAREVQTTSASQSVQQTIDAQRVQASILMGHFDQLLPPPSGQASTFRNPSSLPGGDASERTNVEAASQATNHQDLLQAIISDSNASNMPGERTSTSLNSSFGLPYAASSLQPSSSESLLGDLLAGGQQHLLSALLSNQVQPAPQSTQAFGVTSRINIDQLLTGPLASSPNLGMDPSLAGQLSLSLQSNISNNAPHLAGNTPGNTTITSYFGPNNGARLSSFAESTAGASLQSAFAAPLALMELQMRQNQQVQQDQERQIQEALLAARLGFGSNPGNMSNFEGHHSQNRPGMPGSRS